MSSITRLGPRLIDPRGQRFGAGASAIVLGLAVLLQSPLLVALVAVSLGVSSLFGLRTVRLRATLADRPPPPPLGPPAYQEPEFGPRFAQALGFLFLAVGVVLVVAGLTPLGWLPVLAVVGLQATLAADRLLPGLQAVRPELVAAGAVRPLRPPPRPRGGAGRLSDPGRVERPGPTRSGAPRWGRGGPPGAPARPRRRRRRRG